MEKMDFFHPLPKHTHDEKETETRKWKCVNKKADSNDDTITFLALA